MFGMQYLNHMYGNEVMCIFHLKLTEWVPKILELNLLTYIEI